MRLGAMPRKEPHLPAEKCDVADPSVAPCRWLLQWSVAGMMLRAGDRGGHSAGSVSPSSAGASGALTGAL
jgi:hypothetical protein